ncbi:hypothetical protein J6590_000108 [Homalodisca vitripennis]|nr:hypothetical protein J6590_000108 [Homalodisca vitripennis]
MLKPTQSTIHATRLHALHGLRPPPFPTRNMSLTISRKRVGYGSQFLRYCHRANSTDGMLEFGNFIFNKDVEVHFFSDDISQKVPSIVVYIRMKFIICEPFAPTGKSHYIPYSYYCLRTLCFPARGTGSTGFKKHNSPTWKFNNKQGGGLKSESKTNTGAR